MESPLYARRTLLRTALAIGQRELLQVPQDRRFL
jgi:hypothetical protein